MNDTKKVLMVVVGTAVALAITGACAKSEGDGTKNVSNKSSEAAVVTNENGSVSRTFTECTVSTNGNLVTEHRRETRTTTDTDGNMLETSTSEYAQSYPVGDVGLKASLSTKPAEEAKDEPAVTTADSFLGLKFGSVFNSTNFVKDVDEPTMLRATFTPKKGLAGFDDYYVYVTPTSHKVVKVYACAKKAVEPGARYRRHYLIEALEKRYQTWARLCSFSRPCYAFDLGSGRYVTACLAGASRSYETMLVGWDNNLLTDAADETEAIREAERKTAAEKREGKVKEAADAF